LSAVVRVSKRNGRKGPRFLSPSEQRKAIKAWAAANGVIIVNWYDESDSVSGRTTARPGLQAALAEIEAGRSDGLIVAKVDRFCRNLVEGLLAVRKLQHDGHVFVATIDGIVAIDAQDFATNLLLSLMLLFAEWQWNSLRSQLNDSRTDAVARGVAGNAPYGYDKDDDGRLVKHASEAQIVVLIFSLRARGWSLPEIADELTTREVPKRNAPGQRWVPTAVLRILNNRTYLGELRSGAAVNRKAGHPRLVTQAQWDKAHKLRATQRRGRSLFLLSGVVRCASCGSRMVGCSDGGRRRYRCKSSNSWGRCPAPAGVPSDDLDKAVLERLHEDYLSNTSWQGTLTDDDEVLGAKQRLVDAEAELRSFLDNDVTRSVIERLGAAQVQSSADKHIMAVEVARLDLRDVENRAVKAHVPHNLDGGVWAKLSHERKRDVIAVLYPVVAVAPQARRRSRWEPSIGGRVRIWRAREEGLPAGLPGLGGQCVEMVPIAV